MNRSPPSPWRPASGYDRAKPATSPAPDPRRFGRSPTAPRLFHGPHRRLAGRLAGISEAELESAEAFTSRFARVVDLLVNKVLRRLDRVELKPQGTLLDAVNGAERRGLVESAGTLRELKAVRSEVAHDYAASRLAEIFAYCRAHKAGLDAICLRTETYVRQMSQ